LQIASLEAENVEELLLQQYIRDPGKTVRNVIEEAIAKLGENIAVEKFVRFHI